MIKRFSCHNFRNVNVSDLQLSRINLLIGPNNSGKTNFIKALTFYSDMIKHAKDGNEDTDFLNAMERNGWRHSKNIRASEADNVEFEWQIDLEEDPVFFRFDYQTGKNKADYQITCEKMQKGWDGNDHADSPVYFSAHTFERSGRGFFNDFPVNREEKSPIPFSLSDVESICLQIDRLLIEDSTLYNSPSVMLSVRLIKNLEKAFKRCYRYSSAEIDTKAMRHPVDINGPSRYMKRDCSNYSNIFNCYQSESLLWKSRYLNKLQRYIRRLEGIDTLVRRNDLVTALLDDGRELDLSDLSEGTLKLLVWTMLLSTPEEGAYELLTMDEPENNLHPAWQHVLAEDIVESNAYRQCIISTHSPELLDEFTPFFVSGGDVALLVFSGDGQVRRVRYEDIAEEIGDWKIGDLYRTEDPCLGGWPW